MHACICLEDSGKSLDWEKVWKWLKFAFLWIIFKWQTVSRDLIHAFWRLWAKVENQITGNHISDVIAPWQLNNPTSLFTHICGNNVGYWSLCPITVRVAVNCFTLSKTWITLGLLFYCVTRSSQIKMTRTCLERKEFSDSSWRKKPNAMFPFFQIEFLFLRAILERSSYWEAPDTFQNWKDAILQLVPVQTPHAEYDSHYDSRSPYTALPKWLRDSCSYTETLWGA